MKVRISSVPAIGRLAAVVAAALAIALTFAPARAHAIARGEVLNRANGWVKDHMPYNQSGYYAGYRRDCSGFVSMSWGLGRSLTTRTMGRVAKRVSVARLKPGDAVLMPGHIVIFQRWSSRRHGIYMSMESSGKDIGTIRRLRKLTPVSKGLAYVSIGKVRPPRGPRMARPVASLRRVGLVRRPSPAFWDSLGVPRVSSTWVSIGPGK